MSSRNQDVVTSIRWAEVARIRTFKVDLLTTDCVCLVFEFGNDKPSVLISEEWNGFDELFGPLSAASRRFLRIGTRT